VDFVTSDSSDFVALGAFSIHELKTPSEVKQDENREIQSCCDNKDILIMHMPCVDPCKLICSMYAELMKTCPRE
jgi:hypothetical protein